ncbi:MAG TPA: hypothetical protein VGT82_02620 [Ktedonobacteraceae bacterium]|nr:hypothetical protein [Ktedonobacteraceae bacterium]
MPKTKTRKKAGSTPSVKNTALTRQPVVERPTPVPATGARQLGKAKNPGMQSILMPGMVALGCLGMAFTFVAFSSDPNRLLFAGIAAVMAVMWSVSFGVRLRKILQRR